jgi:1-acyl-sn-glycerol-3-phosphate acyltransferase
MRVAIVGAGIAGLSAAQCLSDDPRQEITVLEAEPRFGGRANVTENGEHCLCLFTGDSAHLFALLDEIPGSDGSIKQSLVKCRPGDIYALPGATDRYLVDPWVAHLRARGVTLRARSQVERLATSAAGVDLWVHGVAERFDAVIVTAFATDAYALLDRSGVPRPLDHRTHAHRRCVTLDLDPREPVLEDPGVRLHASAGLVTLVQPRDRRCVSVAAFPDSPEAVVAGVRSQLHLEHPPVRVCVRENLGSGEAAFVGDPVDPVRLAEPLSPRVYFAGGYTAATSGVDSAESACRSASIALDRLAADHPTVRPRRYPGLPPARRFTPRRAHPNSPPSDRLARGLWWLSRRASALVGDMAADIELLDLSRATWPLGAPAVYIANHRSMFDLPTGVVTFDRLRVLPRIVVQREFFDTAFSPYLKGLGALPALRGTNATVTAAEAALAAGDSVAFMVEGKLTPRSAAEHAPHGSGAALAALRTNAPVVPIAAYGTDAVWRSRRPWPPRRRNRPKVVVAIGEPFHPETSSLDELMDDMRTILLHLEGLARERACGPEPRPLAIVA